MPQKPTTQGERSFLGVKVDGGSLYALFCEAHVQTPVSPSPSEPKAPSPPSKSKSKARAKGRPLVCSFKIGGDTHLVMPFDWYIPSSELTGSLKDAWTDRFRREAWVLYCTFRHPDREIAHRSSVLALREVWSKRGIFDDEMFFLVQNGFTLTD
jgi:hypothetical protein